MENQVTNYDTIFQDGNGSGLFVQKPDGRGSIENVIHNFAVFGLSASGSNQQVVAAVSGKKIRVVQFRVHAAAIASMYFLNGTTPVTFDISFTAGEKFGEDFNRFGWFETAAGAALNARVTTSAVGGYLGYVLI